MGRQVVKRMERRTEAQTYIEGKIYKAGWIGQGKRNRQEEVGSDAVRVQLVQPDTGKYCLLGFRGL